MRFEVFRQWGRQLDHLLRGDATDPTQLKEGRIDVSLPMLLKILILLGLFTGLCTGSYALRYDDWPDGMQQFLSSGIKMPMLFFLTFLITLPSLYVFSALVGSRLSMATVLRLLLAAMGVMLAVAASLGPIVVFFTLSTSSYPFMVLLNVVSLGIAGLLGLAFLTRTLQRLLALQVIHEEQIPELEQTDPKTKEIAPEELDERRRRIDLLSDTQARAKVVFRIWLVVVAVVGTQMSWILRPFIGSPTTGFSVFRDQEKNFFIAVYESLQALAR